MKIKNNQSSIRKINKIDTYVKNKKINKKQEKRRISNIKSNSKNCNSFLS